MDKKLIAQLIEVATAKISHVYNGMCPDAAIETAEKNAGVQYDSAYATSDHPYVEIIKCANAMGCDLIAMASHGRKGLRGLLIGSEAQKVLTQA
jgi:nucleotide-binding universal stress UspA family protein